MKVWVGFLALLLVVAGSARAATVTGIDFKQGEGESVLEIRLDAPITAEKTDDAEGKQAVVALGDAKIAKSVKRPLDASSFSSKVLLITPHEASGEGPSKVIVQFRDAAETELVQEGNLVKLVVKNDVPGEAAAPSTAPEAAGDSAPSEAEEGGKKETAESEGGESAPEAAAGESGGLAAFESAAATKQFKGRRITINVKDADVVDVFRLIGEASGFNVLLSSQVTGKMTLKMEDVPWDQVLDVVLASSNLGAERNGNILRVLPMAELQRQRDDEAKAKKAAEAMAPKVTRIFPINYADLRSIQTMLGKFLAPTDSAASAVSATATANNVIPDTQTNSLVINDTLENIEKARKIIETLDKQQPQVLVEAKVVEASETFGKGLGGNLGFGDTSTLTNSNGSAQYYGAFNGGNPVDALLGSAGVFTGAGIAGTSAQGSDMGISLGILPGSIRLNALLKISESEAETKIISSPRLVVKNNKSATILQSTPLIGPPQTTFGAGSASTGAAIIDSQLSLGVKPMVNNDGSVNMELNISRDVPIDTAAGPQNGKRNITTEVLVESGATLVIGGVFSNDETKTSSGFPILRKIPILGWFFGGESTRSGRTELFIFVTPRVLNTKEAGLADS